MRDEFPDSLIFVAVNVWAALRHPMLTIACRRRMGRFANFARPASLNELMQWRKVFDRNPLFVTFSDKLAAKAWAAGACPDLAAPEVVWTGTSVAKLPAGFLEPSFVIKMNNSSGRNYFPGRRPWAPDTLKRRFGRWLRWPRRHLLEWGYYHIPRKIFAERLVGDGNLVDLTFRCHDGQVAIAFAATRWKTRSERCRYLYPDGRVVPGQAGAAPAFDPGPAYHRARELAGLLSRGVDHLRVDFLVDGDRLWFGELTCYSGSGFDDEAEAGVEAAIEDAWLGAMHANWFLNRGHGFLAGLYVAAFRRWIVERRTQLAALLPASNALPSANAETVPADELRKAA